VAVMGANCQCERQPNGKVVILAEATPINILPASCTSMAMANDKDSKGMLNHRLLTACRDNDVPGVRKALEDGAYLETRRPFVMRPKPPTAMGAISEATTGGGKKKHVARTGLTPLMYSAQNGSVTVTTLLLESRAAVNARDEDGIRPVHLAAAAGSLEVCQLLIKNGAEKVAVDNEGRLPFDHIPSDNIFTRAERAQWEEVLGGQSSAVSSCSAPAASQLSEGSSSLPVVPAVTQVSAATGGNMPSGVFPAAPVPKGPASSSSSLPLESEPARESPLLVVDGSSDETAPAAGCVDLLGAVDFFQDSSGSAVGSSCAPSASEPAEESPLVAATPVDTMLADTTETVDVPSFTFPAAPAAVDLLGLEKSADPTDAPMDVDFLGLTEMEALNGTEPDVSIPAATGLLDLSPLTAHFAEEVASDPPAATQGT